MDYKDVIGKGIPIPETEVKRITEYIDERRAEGILAFRQTNTPVDFCSSKQRVKIIVDSVEIFTDENDQLKMLVDGKDIGDIRAITIVNKKDDYPEISVHFDLLPLRRRRKAD